MLRRRNPQDEREVKASLTEKGRAIRAETKTLANALYDKAGMPVDQLAGLNELRDAFRAG
jgi:DNA-binding MarR family transcriptional regulator